MIHQNVSVEKVHENLFKNMTLFLFIYFSVCVCVLMCWEITESTADFIQHWELVKGVVMRARSVSSVISSNICCVVFCLNFILPSCLSPAQMVCGITRPLLNKIHVEFCHI